MSKKRNRAILLTSLSWAAQRLIQLLSSLITLPLALHGLGLAGFGVWGAATSLLSLSSMLTMGLGSALITLLPYALSAGRAEQGRAYVAASLLGSVALSGLLLLGMAVVFRFTSMTVPSSPFLVAGVGLVLNIPFSLGSEIWLALQKGYMAALWNLTQTILSLAGLAAGVLAGASVTTLVGVFYGALLFANIGNLLHAMLANPAIRPRRPPGGAEMWLVLRQGGLLSSVMALGAFSFVFDNVMALAWLGPAASALMAVAMRVCLAATGLLDSITQPFWPSFADALAAKDHGWIRRATRHGTGAVLLLSLTGSGLLILTGQPVLHWWLHRDVGITPALLRIMAFWIVAMTLTGIPTSLLRASATLTPQIIILGITAIASFGLKYFAARQFGIDGILMVSPLLWIAFVVPGYFFLIRHIFRKELATGPEIHEPGF